MLAFYLALLAQFVPRNILQGPAIKLHGVQ